MLIGAGTLVLFALAGLHLIIYLRLLCTVSHCMLKLLKAIYNKNSNKTILNIKEPHIIIIIKAECLWGNKHDVIPTMNGVLGEIPKELP